MITLRHATRNDLGLLRHWDRQPHVLASGAGEWDWENDLGRSPTGREQLIAELDGRPVGFVEISDPALDESQYWGAMGEGYRALDIWIGEETDLGKGYGTEIMRQVISQCFNQPRVQTILIDPLASNTRAHRFYERLGFRFLERRRFDDDDCFVYRLRRDDWMSSE